MAGCPDNPCNVDSLSESNMAVLWQCSLKWRTWWYKEENVPYNPILTSEGGRCDVFNKLPLYFLTNSRKNGALKSFWLKNTLNVGKMCVFFFGNSRMRLSEVLGIKNIPQISNNPMHIFLTANVFSPALQARKCCNSQIWLNPANWDRKEKCKCEFSSAVPRKYLKAENRFCSDSWQQTLRITVHLRRSSGAQ